MDKCNMYNLLDVDFFLQWKSVSRHKDQSCHLFLCISALNCMLIHMLDKGLSSTNDYSVMVIMKHWVIDCLYEFFPIYPVIICSTFAKLHDLQSLWMSFIVLVYGIVMRMCLGWISCLQQETLSPILGSKFFFSLWIQNKFSGERERERERERAREPERERVKEPERERCPLPHLNREL